ncbi:tetratricopeptide repeat protein [Algibacter amylolyticus]|uniref:histidine kinase n=1 Tax=Algibacter amylolyticus TaxID=1608400 RepID=A0A5M7BH34_9FLAO|nr:tetratricopeptide repeat protein [Algibacter amylolyticus]KAA5827738.1 tetratricopeptide repeat protein [Algibacter amylolyticus]MBB5266960.1 two-component sensor histidine kinase [Algibacter amylolyticus]TSJ81983.1 tetratricopeptide repeat protein [Algibacter amylolyticus]
MKKSAILLIIVSLIIQLGYSQNIRKNDSLKELLVTINPDSVVLKSKVYGELIWSYASTRIKLDSARMYTDAYKEFATKNNFEKGIALTNFYYGVINRFEGNYKEGIEHLDQFVDYARKNKDSSQICNGLFQISTIQSNMGNYSESLATNYQLLKIYQSKKDKSSVATHLQMIGNLLRKIGKTNEAIAVYHEAIEIEKELDDKMGLALNYASLGNTYGERKEYDQSEKYYSKALDFAKESNNLSGITYINENLGNLFFEKGEFKKALPYYLEVLNVRESRPSKGELATSLYTVGKTNVSLGQYEKAEEYLLKSLAIAKEIDSKPILLGVYDHLVKLNHKRNNFKEAFNYQSAHMVIIDSIKGKDRINQMLELNTKYETEKKDSELKLLKIEGEKIAQRNQLYLLLALSGLIIAALVGFFGYKNRQQTIKLAKQKKILELTLDDKNTLLKEVHHRVKNSFQIVSSLLYLQSENMVDKEAKIAIKEAENRVRSMVLVHQKLYNKEEIVGIDTKEYITDLVKDIFDSHQIQNKSISYELDIEPLILDVETTTPMGLILNELIINILKHAFKEVTDASKLNIHFSKVKDELILKVMDNGKGFEGEIENTSFGITLMKALSKKLKATLSYTSNYGQGTVVILNIKKFHLMS